MYNLILTSFIPHKCTKPFKTKIKREYLNKNSLKYNPQRGLYHAILYQYWSLWNCFYSSKGSHYCNKVWVKADKINGSLTNGCSHVIRKKLINWKTLKIHLIIIKQNIAIRTVVTQVGLKINDWTVLKLVIILSVSLGILWWLI